MSSQTPIAPLETIQAIDPIEQPASFDPIEQPASLDAPVETASADATMRDRIAQRAYELYERRGRVPGFDAEDWYAAERELLAEEPRSGLAGDSAGDR
jgi:hypothetical protein